MTKTKNASRVLSLVLALVMVLGIVVPASAEDTSEPSNDGIKFTFTVGYATTTTVEGETTTTPIDVNSNNSIVEILEFDADGTERTEKPAITPTFDDDNNGSVALEDLTDPSGEGEGYVYKLRVGGDNGEIVELLKVVKESGFNVSFYKWNTTENTTDSDGTWDEIEPPYDLGQKTLSEYKVTSVTRLEASLYNAKKFERADNLSTEGGSDIADNQTWVIPEIASNLDKAIYDAETILANQDATDEEVTNAVSELESAIQAYNLAIEDGKAPTYTVAVEGGTEDVKGRAVEGETVTIEATVPSGQRFGSWTVNYGAVTLADANASETTFTMPAANVKVTANFVEDTGTGGPRNTEFELFFRNIDKAGFLDPDAVLGALGTEGRVRIVAIRDDNNTLADNGRLFDTKSDDTSGTEGQTFGTEGQAEFELNLDDFKNTKIVAIVNQGDSAESYPTVVKTLFEINSEGEIKAVGETVPGRDKAYVVTLQTESDPDAKNIRVMFNGDPVDDVRLVYEEIDRDGDIVKILGTTSERTDDQGFVRWDEPVEINEGRTTEMAHASREPFDNGSVTVFGTPIANGNGIKITPVRADVEEKIGNRWNPDLALTFYPWTQFQELDEAGRAMGYVAKDTTKGIANPYVIDYGMVEYDVNIKAYTREGTGDQPVVGSTFSVYQLKDNGELGNKLNSGKTNQDGIASFKIPTEETQVVYIDGAFRIINTPYVLVQEDGGDDKAVIPYGGYIYLTGSYMDAVINVSDVKSNLPDQLNLTNLNTAETSAVNIRFDDDTFNIEVLNSRDGIARLESDDIYKNSVEVAQAAYPNGLVKDKFEGYKNVVIATAENGKLADALTAGSVAALYDAPLLVVDEDNLADDVAKYIDDAGADRAIIVGGPNTVSDRVASQLETITGRVKRFQGENRFETAAAVAKDVLAKSDNNTVILANGQANEKFADALAVSSVAGKYNYPVLLTDYDKLVPATQKALEDLDIEKVYVIGGDNTISEETVRQVNNVASVTTVERVAGDTRFDTAVEIAKKFYPDATQAVYVNGEDNVLALIAGPFAETKDAPVILVGNDVPQSVEEYIPASKITQGYLVGDDSSITDEVRRELSNLMDENR